MSIFDGQINESEGVKIYKNLCAKAPNQKMGEENRCISAFTDLWGSDVVDIPDTNYRTVANPISREVASEVLGYLGTEAYKIFASHSMWQDSIMIINPDWKKLVPPYEVIFNEDGSAQLKDAEE
jgi:hypothetical protein